MSSTGKDEKKKRQDQNQRRTNIQGMGRERASCGQVRVVIHQKTKRRENTWSTTLTWKSFANPITWPHITFISLTIHDIDDNFLGSSMWFLHGPINLDYV